ARLPGQKPGFNTHTSLPARESLNSSARHPRYIPSAVGTDPESRTGGPGRMFFCTERYLVFFLAVLTAYWMLPWHRARVWLLLAASFYFYASWNRWLALVVAGSSAADFLLARVMDGTARRGLRRLCLSTSVCGNLGLLCYFKYANFF